MPDPSERPLTVVDVAVHHPTVHPADATVGEVRAFLDGAHVHLALVVDRAGRLLTTLTRTDLEGLDDGAAAREAGTLAGRTVRADRPAEDLPEHLAALGTRRAAVVDRAGVLVGLVCRKRSGAGYCSDDGIRSRRAERGAASL